MEYRQLGRSGMKVPALSLGTATFGGAGAFFERWGTTQDDKAQRIVDLSLDHGISLFDSADIYMQIALASPDTAFYFLEGDTALALRRVR